MKRLPTGFGHSSGKNNAFTLVEIMIVVMIIGLVAVIAIPSLLRARMNSQASAIVNDLRVFESCFDSYSFVHYGAYPPTDILPGTYPIGMETNWLPVTWIGPTPSAGFYAFENGGGSAPHKISILSPGMDSRLIDRVDEMMDGTQDLTTGRVRSNPDGLDYILSE